MSIHKANQTTVFFGNMISKSIGKKIKQEEQRKKHQLISGDWEYDSAIKFFDMEKSKPYITTQDLIDGKETVLQRHLDIAEWEERKNAFENFMNRKYKGVVTGTWKFLWWNGIKYKY